MKTDVITGNSGAHFLAWVLQAARYWSIRCSHNDANKTGREYKDQTFLGLLDSSEETVLHDELVNFEVTGFEWLCQKRLEVKQEVLCEARPVTYR